MPGDEMFFDRRQIFFKVRIARLRVTVSRKDTFCAGIRQESVRTWPREEPRYEVGPIGGQFEQSFIHQLQIEIAAPNIEYENHLRPQGGDVCEVLFRADTKINAAGPGCSIQLWNDILEPKFIGKQIIGPEKSIGFRKV